MWERASLGTGFEERLQTQQGGCGLVATDFTKSKCLSFGGWHRQRRRHRHCVKSELFLAHRLQGGTWSLLYNISDNSNPRAVGCRRRTSYPHGRLQTSTVKWQYLVTSRAEAFDERGSLFQACPLVVGRARGTSRIRHNSVKPKPIVEAVRRHPSGRGGQLRRIGRRFCEGPTRVTSW